MCLERHLAVFIPLYWPENDSYEEDSSSSSHQGLCAASICLCRSSSGLRNSGNLWNYLVARFREFTRGVFQLVFAFVNRLNHATLLNNQTDLYDFQTTNVLLVFWWCVMLVQSLIMTHNWLLLAHLTFVQFRCALDLLFASCVANAVGRINYYFFVIQ